jgi:Zn-finger nucleic acid-binding protein
MSPVTIGGEAMRECDRCAGIWLDVAGFNRICADSEKQSIVLGGATPPPPDRAASAEPIRYISCPQCGQLMNRMNFARCSGVIVDVCKGHGTWFDADELSEIVQFIRDGGLDLARQKEKRELQFQRERLHLEQSLSGPSTEIFGISIKGEEGFAGFSGARGFLKILLE